MSQLAQPPQQPHQGRHLSGLISSADEDDQHDAAAEQERPLKRNKVEEQEAGESSYSFCEICAERKEQDQMLRIEFCSHAPYCSDCISRHVATKVQNGAATVACPGVGCGAAIELESCRAVLSKGVIERWEESLCRELIGKSEVFYCPFKDCSAMLVVESEREVLSSMRESECPHCHRLFCAQCRVAWHSGFDCRGFQRLSEVEGKGKEDIVVIEMAKSNKWGRCPRCKFYVERIEGCPHITCRCKYEFCYGCGADWSRYHGGCSRD